MHRLRSDALKGRPRKGGQGKSEETRGLLEEIYGWFTEGFGTADLKEAKALLEEVS